MTNFDMTRFFQFSRLEEPGVPRFSSSSGRFEGGMRTNYGSFRSDDDSRDRKKHRPYRNNGKSSTAPPTTTTPLKRNPGEVHYTLIIDTVYPYSKSQKPVIAANYSSPGPLLEAYDDETFVIRVINRLNVPSTMHWHGMRQFGTQDMDGAVGLTQCAIPPKGEMIYRFKADPPGTAWYHGHLLEQYSDGLYGPLIVRRRQKEPNQEFYASEKVLMVSDWYNNRSHDELIPWYINANNPDGVEPSPDAILVNDKFTQSLFVSLKNVPRVRFRIINAAAFSMYTVSIDGLPLHIIEVDSSPTVPYVVGSFTINVGQRVSFYIDWNELSFAADAVFIRFQAMLAMYPVDIVNYIPPYASQQYPYPTFFNPLYLAFLALNSANSTPSYSASDPVPVLSNVNARVDTNLLDARPFDPVKNVVPPATHRLNLLVVFQPDTAGINRPSINDVTYTSDANYMHMRPDPPTGITSDLYAPLLHQMATKPNALGIPSPKVEDGNPLPVIQSDKNGHYLIPYQAVVDILINNTDGGEHPFHLHGYTFWIIATSDYPQAETLFAGQYIQRDTVSVPASGWAKIRFLANNPGAWFFHCHIEWHMSAGLAMALLVSPERLLANGYTVTPAQTELCKALQKFNSKVGTTNY